MKVYSLYSIYIGHLPIIWGRVRICEVSGVCRHVYLLRYFAVLLRPVAVCTVCDYKAKDGEEINTAFWMMSWIRYGGELCIYWNQWYAYSHITLWIRSNGRKKLKSTKVKMEGRRSMKTDKARNSLYPVAPGVPLILCFLKRGAEPDPETFCLCISSSERYIPSYSLKFPICCLIANCFSIPLETSGFCVPPPPCLTLKANIFCTRSNLVIFVIIIIITPSKPTLPLLSFLS